MNSRAGCSKVSVNRKQGVFCAKLVLILVVWMLITYLAIQRVNCN